LKKIENTQSWLIENIIINYTRAALSRSLKLQNCQGSQTQRTSVREPTLNPAGSFMKTASSLKISKQGGVLQVALSFTLKSIIRQKKNYGNSNISPCKNIIFKKLSKRNQNP
jgi:hypothetical protein